jgi:hypothetical protein
MRSSHIVQHSCPFGANLSSGYSFVSPPFVVRNHTFARFSNRFVGPIDHPGLLHPLELCRGLANQAFERAGKMGLVGVAKLIHRVEDRDALL